MKNVQATGEVFIPQKRSFSTSKLKISSLLWVFFALLDLDPADQIEGGCGSATLVFFSVLINHMMFAQPHEKITEALTSVKSISRTDAATLLGKYRR
jgi:hypothetical protein